MSKVFKDEKIFNKFKKEFKFIFKDENLWLNNENNFDKKGCLVAFSLAFLKNRLDEETLKKNLIINKIEWVDCFNILCTDPNIAKAMEAISLNPIANLSLIENNFLCFENFINKFLSYIKEQGWSLNISDEDVKKLLTSCFGYIMYNNVECKLSNSVEQLIQDQQYDQKYLIVLNNTKLFAKAKKQILDLCGEKINDLIVILLGGSNHLALDK